MNREESAEWLRDQVQLVHSRGVRRMIIVAPSLLSLQVVHEAVIVPSGLEEALLRTFVDQALTMKLPLLCVHIERWSVDSLFFLTKTAELHIIGFSEEKDFQLFTRSDATPLDGLSNIERAESKSEQSAMDMLKRWSKVRVAAKLLHAPIISTAHELVFDEGGSEAANLVSSNLG